MLEVVNYVKRRYHSTTTVSEAWKLFVETLGIGPLPNTQFDFWLETLLDGKEYHVTGYDGEEIIDQYIITKTWQ